MLDRLIFLSAVLAACGLGVFILVAPPQVRKNYEGLAKCQKLHPIRYCRIANGFPVEPLPLP